MLPPLLFPWPRSALPHFFHSRIAAVGDECSFSRRDIVKIFPFPEVTGTTKRNLYFHRTSKTRQIYSSESSPAPSLPHASMVRSVYDGFKYFWIRSRKCKYSDISFCISSVLWQIFILVQLSPPPGSTYPVNLPNLPRKLNRKNDVFRFQFPLRI